MRKLPAAWEPWLLTAGAAGLAWFAVFHAGPYGLRVLTVAGAYALAVLGYQLVFGLCGALSLAQGAFFGVGAYVSGFLALRWGLDFAVTAPLAIIAPMALALLVGGAVLRLESHYFALATLGVAQIVLLAVINGPAALGGANGLPGVPGVALFGFAIPRGLALAALAWGLAGLGALLAWWLTVSRFGRALVLVREDPLTAACLGLDVGRLRLAAFALSAGFAGLGGALAAHAQRVISPEALEFPVMVAVLTMAVIGGRGRAAGAILGALLIVFLPEWLGGLGQARLLFYAAALLAAVVLLPDGIMGLFGESRAQPKGRGFNNDVIPLPWGERALSVIKQSLAPLVVEDLCKSFGGVRALDDVSFTLDPGEIVGLIGPNGSGKTTLINLLSGVEAAESGAVRLGERRLPGLAHLRARAGLARTFQTPALPPGFSVLDVAASAGFAQGMSVAAARAAAWPILTMAGLADAAPTLAAALPMGLRRRVDLARALLRRPAVLLLDEPAAGLSAAERAATAALIRDAAACGAAVLVVEHDMEFLLPLCRRVLCLDRGRLIYDGPAEVAAASPLVRDAYFGGAS